MKDVKNVLVEMRGMVLRREYELRVEIALLRKDILDIFPLNIPHGDDIEFIFSSPVIQQVLMEKVQKTLLLKGINTPNETDVAAATLELCFSGYVRAHTTVPTKNRG